MIIKFRRNKFEMKLISRNCIKILFLFILIYSFLISHRYIIFAYKLTTNFNLVSVLTIRELNNKDNKNNLHLILDSVLIKITKINKINSNNKILI